MTCHFIQLDDTYKPNKLYIVPTYKLRDYSN